MKHRIVLFTIIISFMNVMTLYAEDTLRFVFSSSSLYAYENEGKIVGLQINLIEEIFVKRMGVKVSYRLRPWARANSEVKNGEADALMTNGPLRKEWADHGEEVWFNLTQSIYTWKGNPLIPEFKKTQTLEELKPYNFIGHRGSGWETRHLVNPGFSITQVTNPETIYLMLAFKRGDLAIAYDFQALFFMHKNPELRKKIEKVPVDLGFDIPMHYMVGKKSPQWKWTVKRFDEELRKMKESGEYQTLWNFEKYLKEHPEMFDLL